MTFFIQAKKSYHIFMFFDQFNEHLNHDEDYIRPYGFVCILKEPVTQKTESREDWFHFANKRKAKFKHN